MCGCLVDSFADVCDNRFKRPPGKSDVFDDQTKNSRLFWKRIIVLRTEYVLTMNFYQKKKFRTKVTKFLSDVDVDA